MLKFARPYQNQFEIGIAKSSPQMLSIKICPQQSSTMTTTTMMMMMLMVMRMMVMITTMMMMLMAMIILIMAVMLVIIITSAWPDYHRHINVVIVRIHV